MSCNHCNKCIKCRTGKKCPSPCGCAEPVFSIDSMSDNPSLLKFNVNGKSIWYDFDSVVKASETCTTLTVNGTDRTLEYNGECGKNTIHASQLGSILHLADIGDVDAESIGDNGILNYRKDANCGEGCDGIGDGWVSTNPIDVGTTSLEYILGSDKDGKMQSLMPPTDTSTFSYLAWAGANKVMWKKPTVVSAAPVDGNGKKWQVFVDPNTYELVIVKV